VRISGHGDFGVRARGGPVPPGRVRACRITVAALVSFVLVAAVGCGQIRPPGQKQYLVRHTVEKGDTLYSIAWRYGFDYRQVAAWNNIQSPYEIYPGEELLIIPPNRYSGPRESRSSSAASQKAPEPSPTRRSTRATAPKARNSSPVTASGGPVAWAWPTLGEIAGRFAPDSGKKGIDIAGKSGQPIRAAGRGTVVYSGKGLRGYGNLLIIKHNETYLSAYGHNKKLLVKEGDTVEKGENIARMGQKSKSGSILYFEIRRGGKPVDPLKQLPEKRL